MSWLGQHIWGFISRFRNKIYIETIETGTSDKVLVRESDGLVKQKDCKCAKGDEVKEVLGTSPIQVDNTDVEKPVVSVTAASGSGRGTMAAADFTKLTGIETGATRNVGEVKEVKGTSPITVDSTDPEKPIVEVATASSTTTGVMTSGDFTKLAGIETGATRNVGEVKEVKGTAPVSVDNEDPEKPVVSIAESRDGSSGLMSGSDKAKLDGIAAGADVTPTWVPAKDPSYLTAATAPITSITTTGSSGKASLSKTGVLNIPEYAGTVAGVSGKITVVSDISKGVNSYLEITITNGLITATKATSSGSADNEHSPASEK